MNKYESAWLANIGWLGWWRVRLGMWMCRKFGFAFVDLPAFFRPKLYLKVGGTKEETAAKLQVLVDIVALVKFYRVSLSDTPTGRIILAGLSNRLGRNMWDDIAFCHLIDTCEHDQPRQALLDALLDKGVLPVHLWAISVQQRIYLAKWLKYEHKTLH